VYLIQGRQIEVGLTGVDLSSEEELKNHQPGDS
jgi:hypothetical protein